MPEKNSHKTRKEKKLSLLADDNCLHQKFQGIYKKNLKLISEFTKVSE